MKNDLFASPGSGLSTVISVNVKGLSNTFNNDTVALLNLLFTLTCSIDAAESCCDAAESCWLKRLRSLVRAVFFTASDTDNKGWVKDFKLCLNLDANLQQGLFQMYLFVNIIQILLPSITYCNILAFSFIKSVLNS